MRDEVLLSLCRYEAMTGLSDWLDEACPGQEDQDRASYGKDYGLLAGKDGRQYTSTARMVRFLVEVCGHSYQEALDAVVEHFQNMPSKALPNREDPGQVARQMTESYGNILEALVDLKISRLVSAGDESALSYNWGITDRLLQMRRPPVRPASRTAKGRLKRG